MRSCNSFEVAFWKAHEFNLWEIRGLKRRFTQITKGRFITWSEEDTSIWLFIVLQLINWVLVQILQVNKHRYLLIKSKLIINLVLFIHHVRLDRLGIRAIGPWILILCILFVAKHSSDVLRIIVLILLMTNTFFLIH